MPDITNDFDNNPNTDKRKQRDEEVNNDNLQPEQTKSEPELLEQTKSKEFSIPIFAKLYDRCNLKIDELNLKNDKLNAKIEKLNIKKVRSAEFVSTVESMRNVVPMPVYKALSVLSAERRQKIVNINEKIHSHKLNIKSNEQKILKQQSRAENCKKIRLSKMQTLLLIMSNKRMIKPKLRDKNYKAILDLCHSGTGLF